MEFPALISLLVSFFFLSIFLSLYLSFLASSHGSPTVNNIKDSSNIQPAPNATTLMSKALAGFGTGSPAKPKSAASPLGAAVVAAAQAQAVSEAKQQQSPTAKAVTNVVTGRYVLPTHPLANSQGCV